MRLTGCAADLLRQYFSGKLAAFSQASQNASAGSVSDEGAEEQAEAMDVGSSPQPAASVMGQKWADQLPQILGFLKQLGLQVSPPSPPQAPPHLNAPAPAPRTILAKAKKSLGLGLSSKWLISSDLPIYIPACAHFMCNASMCFVASSGNSCACRLPWKLFAYRYSTGRGQGPTLHIVAFLRGCHVDIIIMA